MSMSFLQVFLLAPLFPLFSVSVDAARPNDYVTGALSSGALPSDSSVVSQADRTQKSRVTRLHHPESAGPKSPLVAEHIRPTETKVQLSTDGADHTKATKAAARRADLVQHIPTADSYEAASGDRSAPHLEAAKEIPAPDNSKKSLNLVDVVEACWVACQNVLGSHPMAGWYCAGAMAACCGVILSVLLSYLRRASRDLKQLDVPNRHQFDSRMSEKKMKTIEYPIKHEIAKPVEIPEPHGCDNQVEFDDTDDVDGLDQACLQIPQSFKCPITKEIMTYPVSTIDGLTYERESILAWFRLGNRTSPLTNVLLPSLQLTKNIALRSAIAEFLRLRPELQARELQRQDFEALVLEREKELEQLATKCSKMNDLLEKKDAEIKERNFRVAMLEIEANSISRHLNVAPGNAAVEDELAWKDSEPAE